MIKPRASHRLGCLLPLSYTASPRLPNFKAGLKKGGNELLIFFFLNLQSWRLTIQFFLELALLSTNYTGGKVCGWGYYQRSWVEVTTKAFSDLQSFHHAVRVQPQPGHREGDKGLEELRGWGAHIQRTDSRCLWVSLCLSLYECVCVCASLSLS